MVIISGSISYCSIANKDPVLQKPVCTSSAINNTSFSVQYLFSSFIPDLEAGINPPSPRTGSITAQAMFSGLTLSKFILFSLFG